MIVSFTAMRSARSQPNLHHYLAPYQWENRLVLIFSPNENQRLYRAQLLEFQENESGMQERDLLLIRIFKDRAISANSKTLNEETAHSLRRHFQIPDGETVVLLIGKDGSEKLRSKELLTTRRLFKTIDAMPMRIQEMRRKQ